MAQTVPLFAPLPPVDLDTWQTRVAEDLGDPTLDSLVTRLREGLAVAPLYGPETAPPAHAAPGQPPFVRGHRPGGGEPPWQVGQRYCPRTPEEAVAGLLADLRRGVRLAWLSLPVDGAAEDFARDFGSRLAATVQSEDVEAPGLILDAGAASVAAARGWSTAVEANVETLASLDVTVHADPLGAWARGALDGEGQDSAWREILRQADGGRERTGRRASVVVSTWDHHLAGADAVEELAIAVATGVAYLRRWGAAGWTAAQAARRMTFVFAVDRDLFLEIAKLRAGRWLWSKVLRAAAGEDDDVVAPMTIVARTSTRAYSHHAPWTNLLRATVAGCGAVLGGADAVVVEPHDALAATPEPLGARLAVNLQHVLAEEAHLGRVADPAGGSWYVERLTEDLARRAWARFREIEAAGGMASEIASGRLVDRLDRTGAERARDTAHRAAPLIGISAFPDLDQVVPSPAPAPLDGPLRPRRLAEPFEALRAAAARVRPAPRVLLVRLGPVRGHQARAAFAVRALAAGGIATVELGVDAAPTAARTALAESGLDVAVLCGSDAVYADIGAWVEALRAGGARWLVRAGGPEAAADGVDAVLRDGADLVAFLGDLQAVLGVAS